MLLNGANVVDKAGPEPPAARLDRLARLETRTTLSACKLLAWQLLFAPFSLPKLRNNVLKGNNMRKLLRVVRRLMRMLAMDDFLSGLFRAYFIEVRPKLVLRLAMTNMVEKYMKCLNL